jgi:hypothetical protein
LKLSRFFPLICTGILLCFLSGCNDDPDPVGAGTQSPRDYGIIHVDTFYTTVELPAYPSLLSTSSIDRTMLGIYRTPQNQTYEAWACLLFYYWPDSLFGATILGATVQLRPFYNFGNSSSPLSLDAFRAKASIFGDSLTLNDSLDGNASYYYDNVRINTPATIQSGDTLCLFDIDTAVVREWFISNTDSTGRNCGLILRPSNTNVIKGFYSFSASDTALQPTLYVHYRDTSGNEGWYTHKTGISRYVSKFNPPSFFEDAGDGKIRVQNGISYWGMLNLESHSFDSLASLYPFIIQRAVLQITLDSASSSCTLQPFANDQLFALSVGTDNKVDGSLYALSTKLSDTLVYQFDILNLLPPCIKNTTARKINLAGYFESGSFDLFTFYGAESTINQKPKIIITYKTIR